MESINYKHSYKVTERPLTSLSVYNTGLQACVAGYAWGPGVRDHYLLHYVTAGRGTYTAGGKTYSIGPGDMFLAFPHTLITYRAGTEDPWSYCWVGFGGLDAAALVAQTAFAPDSPVLHSPDEAAARALILDIYEARGAKPPALARMTGRLYAFLAWLMESAAAPARKAPGAGLEHVERACAFIAGNYASPITVTAIARSVGVCRSLLNRAFQQYMDVSPVQYLTRYRMTQACLLLARTDMPVKAVAYSVGYEDPLYFSRRFRECMGVSPRQYIERAARESVPSP